MGAWGQGGKGGANIWVSIDMALMKAGIIGEKGTLVRTIWKHRTQDEAPILKNKLLILG